MGFLDRLFRRNPVQQGQPTKGQEQKEHPASDALETMGVADLLSALKDPDGEVREAAASRLERMSRNDTCPAICALTDPQILAGVVREFEDSYQIGLAVERIQDEALLLELLADSANCKSVEMAPYEIVTQGKFSPETLVHIARTYPSQKARVIERITDPEVLVQFAFESKDPTDRLAAVEKLGDQAVLADLARTDADLGVRAAAVARLTDASLAARLSEELERMVNDGLGDKEWPSAWRSLEYGPYLISILETATAPGSECPYYDSGVCMSRVMAQGDTSSGPDACSWPGRPHAACHVFGLAPR